MKVRKVIEPAKRPGGVGSRPSPAQVCKLCRTARWPTLWHISCALSGRLEQECRWLQRAHPDDEALQVSHETIYRSLFIQARGALKKELTAHLRRTRGMRRSRHHTQKTSIHGQISDADRSASVPLSSKIVRFLVTGEVTFCSVAVTARLPPLLNASHADAGEDWQEGY